MTTLQGFGHRVKVALVDADLTRQECADAVGVSRDVLTRMVTKDFVPNGLTVAKCAKTLGVTTDWLLGMDREE